TNSGPRVFGPVGHGAWSLEGREGCHGCFANGLTQIFADNADNCVKCVREGDWCARYCGWCHGCVFRCG
ncbi:MAG: hypothetical protein ACKON9_18085, partial [Planctomycetaceae bacterium]